MENVVDSAVENVTVKELDELVGKLRKLKDEKAEKEAATTEVNKKIASLNAKIRDILQSMGRENYRTDAGSVYLKEKINIKLPKTWESKKALLDYLKAISIDTMHDYITFNASSLKSFVKEEIAARTLEGDLNMEFPGIGVPGTFMDIEMRRS